MTDMEFRPMRRGKQQLSDDEAKAILEAGTNGVLALAGDGGYPYAVPLSYVYADGKIYFHSAKSGHKLDAIRSCDKASFCVVAQDQVVPSEYTTYFRSVIAFGTVRVLEDEEERAEATRALGRKYNPGDEEALAAEMASGLHRMEVIELTIEHLTGKEAIELVRQRRKAQASPEPSAE